MSKVQINTDDMTLKIDNENLLKNLEKLTNGVLNEAQTQTKETIENIGETIKAEADVNIEAQTNAEIVADVKPEDPKQTKEKTKKATEQIEDTVKQAVNEIPETEVEKVIVLNSKIKSPKYNKNYDISALNNIILKAWNEKNPIKSINTKALQQEYEEAFFNFTQQSDTYNRVAATNKAYSSNTNIDKTLSNKLNEAEIDAEKRLKEAYVHLSQVNTYILQLTNLIEKIPEIKVKDSDMALSLNNRAFSNKENVQRSLNGLTYSSEVISQLDSSLDGKNHESGIIKKLKQNIVDYDNKITENKEAIKNLPEDSDEIASLISENKKLWISIVEDVTRIQSSLGNDTLLTFNTKQLGRIYDQTSTDRFAISSPSKKTTGPSSTVNKEVINKEDVSKVKTTLESGIMPYLGQGDGNDKGLITSLQYACKYVDELASEVLGDKEQFSDIGELNDEQIKKITQILQALENINQTIEYINAQYTNFPENSDLKILTKARSLSKDNNFVGKFNKTYNEDIPYSGVVNSSPSSRSNLKKELYKLLQQQVPNQIDDIKQKASLNNNEDLIGVRGELNKYTEKQIQVAQNLNQSGQNILNASDKFNSITQQLFDTATNVAENSNNYNSLIYNPQKGEKENEDNRKFLLKQGRSVLDKYLDLNSYESQIPFDLERDTEQQTEFLQNYISKLYELIKILDVLQSYDKSPNSKNYKGLTKLASAKLWNGTFEADGSINSDLDSSMNIDTKFTGQKDILEYAKRLFETAGIKVNNSKEKTNSEYKINAIAAAVKKSGVGQDIQQSNVRIEELETALEIANSEKERQKNNYNELENNYVDILSELDTVKTELNNQTKDFEDTMQSYLALQEAFSDKIDETDKLYSENTTLQEKVNSLIEQINQTTQNSDKNTPETINIQNEETGFIELNEQVNQIVDGLKEKNDLLNQEAQIVEEKIKPEAATFGELADNIDRVVNGLKEKNELLNKDDNSSNNIQDIEGVDNNLSKKNKNKKRKVSKKASKGTDNNSDNENNGSDNNGEKPLKIDYADIRSDFQEVISKLVTDYVNNTIDSSASIKTIQVKGTDKGATGYITYTSKKEDTELGKIKTTTIKQTFDILENTTEQAIKELDNFSDELNNTAYAFKANEKTITSKFSDIPKPKEPKVQEEKKDESKSIKDNSPIGPTKPKGYMNTGDYDEKYKTRELQFDKLEKGLQTIGKLDNTRSENDEFISAFSELKAWIKNQSGANNSKNLSEIDTRIKNFKLQYLPDGIQKQLSTIDKNATTKVNLQERIDKALKEILEKETSGIFKTAKPSKQIQAIKNNDSAKYGDAKALVSTQQEKIFTIQQKLNGIEFDNFEKAKEDLKAVNKQLDELEKNIEDIQSQMDLKTQYSKLFNQVQGYVKDNSKLKSNNELKNMSESLILSLQNALNDNNYKYNEDELKKFKSLYADLQYQTNDAGLKGKNYIDAFGDKFDDIILRNIGNFAAASLSNYFRQMVDNVKEIDSAMTELKKVTNETSAAYNNFLKEAGSRAEALGSTMTDLISSTADFAKLGFNLKDASSLAENAIMYSNVGDLDIETATNDIVSAMKAFRIEASDAIKIVDSFNEVGNNYADYKSSYIG